MKITNVDSTNFRATMNISQIKNYQHYWQEVANNFAKKTAETEANMAILNPSGVIGFGITYLKSNSNNGKNSMAYISCTKDCFDKMTNESPEATADKLTKVFSLATELNKKGLNILAKFNEEVKTMNLKANDSEKFRSLYAKNVNAKKDIIMKEVNNSMNNSEELKGFEIFI